MKKKFILLSFMLLACVGIISSCKQVVVEINTNNHALNEGIEISDLECK